ncbi:MAG TPA: toll/interleukin-1 receptor domain-containing protein [Methanomassiliicoccales archaeon]|jgi:hypothetical protein
MELNREEGADAWGLTMKVFLSHSNLDEALARVIKDKIEGLGVSVYMAEDDPRPGQRLPLKLDLAIRSSDILVYLCTESSASSQIVQQEVAFAYALNKQIITLIVGRSTPGGFLVGMEYIKLDEPDSKKGFDTLSVVFTRYVEHETTSQAIFHLIIGAGVGLVAVLTLYFLTRNGEPRVSNPSSKNELPPPLL